jgi:hypothetical protein
LAATGKVSTIRLEMSPIWLSSESAESGKLTGRGCWCSGVVRGNSAVGAEISGPALPRFTSGGSCEVGEGGGFAPTTLQQTARIGRLVINSLSWEKCTFLYWHHDALLGCTIPSWRAAQAPRHSSRKLPSTKSYETTRPPGSAIVHLPSRSAVELSTAYDVFQRPRGR